MLITRITDTFFFILFSNKNIANCASTTAYLVQNVKPILYNQMLFNNLFCLCNDIYLYCLAKYTMIRPSQKKSPSTFVWGMHTIMFFSPKGKCGCYDKNGAFWLASKMLYTIVTRRFLLWTIIYPNCFHRLSFFFKFCLLSFCCFYRMITCEVVSAE